MSSANLPAKTARPQDAALTAIDVVAMKEIAAAVARSGLFGLTEPQAFTLMLLAHSQGLHETQAFLRYHVINNRPAMKADAMLAEFQANGGVVTWARHDAEACQATFECPGVGSPVTITWTRDDAKQAQLLRNPMWDKYPRQMLRARVISEGVRMCMPGISVGIYAEEEARDFVVTERPPTPASPSPALPSPAPQPPPPATSGPASGHVVTEIEDRCRAVEGRFAKEHPDALPVAINRHRVERGVLKDLTGKSTEALKAATVRAKLVELAESRWPEVSDRVWVRIREQYEAAKEVVRLASEAAAKQTDPGDAESLGDGAVDADYDDGLDGVEAGLSG
ncbi:MAG: hypothetical protein VW239_00540 [Candidatus Nanopelagicales bacterium]